MFRCWLMLGCKVALSKTSMAAAGLVAVAIVVVRFVLAGNGEDFPVLKPDDADVVARGETIYAAECSSCHGRRLEGEPNWRVRDEDGYLPAPPHDATGHTWHHSDAQLFNLTKRGLSAVAGDKYKTRMPAYDGVLSDTDIIAVLSFIKSRWPPNIRDRHDRLNAAAKRNMRSDR